MREARPPVVETPSGPPRRAATAGLNQDVFDALVVLAAGGWAPDAIAAGYERVQTLTADMDEGRRRRLTRLGFPADEAADLSALHTRNFM